MTEKSRRVMTVIVGALLGAVVSGLLCFPVWYFVNDTFSPRGFLTHYPAAAGIIGFIFGVIGGSIIGIVVTGASLRKIASILTGGFINGLLPLTPLLLFGANKTPDDNLREFRYASIGQAFVGVAVALLISILASHMERRQTQLRTV
jgi:hypothetical protein